VIHATRPLLLGSASPRRRDILGSLRLPFVILPADISEDVLAGETPRLYLERIVLAKLVAIWARLEREGLPADAPDGLGAVLVADTTVVVDGSIVGKPADVADAAAILSRLVGRAHEVFTRYAIARAEPSDGGVLAARTVRTEVRLRAATAAEVDAYARTGEGLDKAGAYAAQGIGAFLVEGVTGSYSNVVGLPACELVADLTGLGLLAAFPSFDSAG
jgi:septum formation protein